MVYRIFINLTYLRVVSTEYFLLSITCCLLALISEFFIFSYQTASSLLSLTSSYIFFAISQLLYNFLRKVCSFNNSIFIFRSLYLSKLSLNGVYIIVKIIDGRLHFYLLLLFLFFSIFRTTQVRGYQSQDDGVVTRQITRLGRI